MGSRAGVISIFRFARLRYFQDVHDFESVHDLSNFHILWATHCNETSLSVICKKAVLAQQPSGPSAEQSIVPEPSRPSAEPSTSGGQEDGPDGVEEVHWIETSAKSWPLHGAMNLSPPRSVNGILSC